LEPLSVTLPFAARFTGRETASRARQRIQYLVNAKTVTAVGMGRRETAGAVFDVTSNYRLGVGRVSSKRWE